MNPEKNIETRLEQLAQVISSGDSFVNGVMRRLETSSDRVQQKPNPTFVRRLVMKRFTRFAAAAVVIVGISAILLFNQTPGSIALADVYTRVLQIQAFTYKMSMTMSGIGAMTGLSNTGSSTSEGTVTISTEYGMKMENHMQVSVSGGTTQNITQLAYMLPNDKMIVSIMPEQKMYQKIELTGQLLEETKKQNNDPREMIRRMMDCSYVSLGRSEINGIKVQGFETTDPAYGGGVGDVRAILWVDARTGLPVQSEVSATVGEKMKIDSVISDFQWNVPVDATDFAYVIPDDYKDAGSMKMPEMTEEAAIEGLQTYAKFFGRYPPKIDMASLLPSLMKNINELMDNPATEYAKAFVQKIKSAEAAGEQAVMQQTQREFTSVSSLAMFHMKLVQGKQDPAYYGDRITPQDTDAVLLRWKTDSGTYKVIFGDLSVTEMAYEDLIAIEPKTEPAAP